MPIFCVLCEKDVTYAYQMAPTLKPFRCKCGSAEFIALPDVPKVKWELWWNDRRFLKRLGIRDKE